jgi:AcrR family transcriptional regulator
MVKVEPSLRESQSANATIERILDAAEELFAEKGVADTSVRNITDKAGVNVAAVNYHFDTRENLIRRVVERRAAILEEARRNALDRVEDAAQRQNRLPTVEELVNAMIEPVFDLTQDDHNPRWQHFIRLISRIAWEPQVEQLEPPPSTIELFQRFGQMLHRSLPDDDLQRRLWRMAFMRAATQQTLLMIGAVKSGRIPKGMPLAEAAAQTPIEKIRREFVAFVAAGLQAK